MRMRIPVPVSRRHVLQGTVLASLASALGLPRVALSLQRNATRPLPMTAVRLQPSPWLHAVDSNRTYLHRLEPDRLLHDYRLQAGLAPRGERYGGWEKETIAGHSLGHYLSACALMHAQTGDAECRARAHHIVGELRYCQRAHRDGFVGAFTRRNETSGATEPGRLVMQEIARGDIRSARFHLNGCWAPFYNWHKLFAGLLDTDLHCASPEALAVAAGNARRLSLGARAAFRCGDWCDGLEGDFDLIVSNPPYIAEAEIAGLAPEVRLHEPRAALSGGADGLDAYRRIARCAGSFLAARGRMLLEIGPSQAAAVRGILAAGGLKVVSIRQDLDGRDRVIHAIG